MASRAHSVIIVGFPPPFIKGFQGRSQRETWPASMLATSTHDTKRSEDVRARIALLSEAPSEWWAAVNRWSAMNDRHRRDGWPDRNSEWLLYQTLVGAWPIDAQRVAAYMEKATREAKVHTSWLDPIPAYDDAVRAFNETMQSYNDARAEYARSLYTLDAIAGKVNP